MNVARLILVLGIAVVLLGGCAARPSADSGVPQTLASDHLVIGERIAFTGEDGEPVVPVPAVYRVVAKGEGHLALYLGSSKQPLVVQAEAKQVQIPEAVRAAFATPHAVLDMQSDGPARNLWLVRPDGRALAALGAIEGERSRGWLIGRDVLAGFATPVIAYPADGTVVFDRLRKLRVKWTGADSVLVTLVHGPTGLVVQSKLGTASPNANGGYVGVLDMTELHELDPGQYRLNVASTKYGGQTSVLIDVAGRSRSIGVSGTHSLVLAPDGASGSSAKYVWAWGDNRFGQCGPMASGDKTLMRRTGVDAVAVAAGFAFSLALKADGSVVSWGDNRYGQLGRRSPQSTDKRALPVEGPDGFSGAVRAIDAGAHHAIALDAAGAVWVWGLNSSAQCGQESANKFFPAPVRVKQKGGGELTGVIAIAAGRNHSLALKRDGSVWGWGHNQGLQVGAQYPNDAGNSAQLIWSRPPESSKSTRYLAVFASLDVSGALDGPFVDLWGAIPPPLSQGEEPRERIAFPAERMITLGNGARALEPADGKRYCAYSDGFRTHLAPLDYRGVATQSKHFEFGGAVAALHAGPNHIVALGWVDGKWVVYTWGQKNNLYQLGVQTTAGLRGLNLSASYLSVAGFIAPLELKEK